MIPKPFPREAMIARWCWPALLLVGVVALSATGCRKTADGPDAAGEAVVSTGTADPAVAQALDKANAALRKNEYDEAVAALMAAKQSGAMSDQQKTQYRQSMLDTTTRLLEASQTDPKARQAYDALGRLSKGR